jgi:hypothetical protein
MWTARAALQAVAMVASSSERHFQALGLVSGTGKNLLPYAEELLVKLGCHGRKTPRDTHFDFWLNNRGPAPYSFTGSTTFDKVFKIRVNATRDLHADSCNVLRPIAAGDLEDPLSAEAAVAYTQVARNTAQLCEAYRAFTQPADNWPMPQAYFAQLYRQYLIRYPVGGVDLSGVNAANEATQMSLDYLLGLTNESHAARVAESFGYQTEEDLAILKQDIDLPSVTSHIYRKLNYDDAPTNPAEKRWLAIRIVDKGAVAMDALDAYAGAIIESRRLTSIHFSLIHAFLIKPGEPSGGGGRTKLQVPVAAGTGGRSHEETKAVMDMRRDQPAVTTLVTTIKSLLEARKVS